MTPLAKLAVLGSASMVTASVAWFAVTETVPNGGGEAVNTCENGVCACIGADAVLRIVEPGEACPSDHRLLELSELEPEPPEDGDEWDQTEPEETATTKMKPGTLADLERRLSELDKRPLFEVVDKAGNSIFTVAPETVRIYNSGGTAVAAIRATSDGGSFVSRSTTGAYEASIGVSGSRSGVQITEGGVLRADLGKQQHGNYALRFPSPAQGIIAGIGESRAGTGALVIGDFGGAVKASLTADGKGTVGISNGDGATVLALTEGATQGGLLAIGDAASEPMVKFGVAQDRYGVVLTGPKAGFPLIPASGLPGSYIFGCAGGSPKDCGHIEAGD